MLVYQTKKKNIKNNRVENYKNSNYLTAKKYCTPRAIMLVRDGATGGAENVPEKKPRVRACVRACVREI